MQLDFNTSLLNGYTSNSQKMRILTEDWVGRTMFCPNCGAKSITNYENNRPVADFYCQNCKEEYELKSKSGYIGTKITDGAYSTMIKRLNSNSNPNLFILTYDLLSYKIRNFIVIPKYFFIPEIIEKRKPLSDTARRAGWIGCNILLGGVPESGKVFIIRDGRQISMNEVLSKWQKTLFLRHERGVAARGWLLDVMRCVESINKTDFTLDDVYRFESELSGLHPDNNHVKDKIRQQLQALRDRGYLEFTSRGGYHLV